ncbi:flagellar hook protein FlgE [Calorimonas adulescens]|jgi:fagellar hook-basal body proteins|uniref:Flagellar hook protein FlgE n=1 Tax=Calorimonas adulescens TaxID=2606906 RepID=A0A5D8QF90_9THEO|nr:flagellar hook protein FlgE [Calorimonas adulescens]TZE83350.1 flagellar hook protein FlgE [Calorimonas adulescens]
MMRSMFSAISGLKAHQAMMDVIGNNIANVNTPGYKTARITFKDVFSQTLRGATGPQEGRGGTNPQQIGLGVSVASIDNLFTNGSSQRTDNPLDLSISGNGFFVVGDNSGRYFTRAGNFGLDSSGNLVNSSGYLVLGWQADVDGNYDTATEPAALNLFNKLTLGAMPTTNITMGGNLDAGTPDTSPDNEISYNVSIYDSLGNEHILTLHFTRTGSNTWDVSLTTNDSSITSTFPAAVTFTFDANGKLTDTDTVATDGIMTLPITGITYNNGAATQDITISFPIDNFTMFAGDTTAKAVDKDGYAAGTLESFTIDQYGKVVGTYSNGGRQLLGVLAIADFANEGGLQKIGDNLFIDTNNSGNPEIGQAGGRGLGVINPGTLEMSNVDLSQEFTNMIIAQRGFQANSRIITAADELLQELVNMKR